MSRLLALEWDGREARVAIGTTQGRGLVVDDILTIPLSVREDARGGDPQLGNKIMAALSERGIRRADALVAVGRASIELKQLTLPPAPAEELPDLVRFQAMREFHSLGEDWPLDYLPLPGSTEENQSVLAAAIAPELIQQVRAVCGEAGLRIQRLLLRPCELASLFLRQDKGRERVRLLVDLLTEEADLVVLVERSIVFMRTARLPADPTMADVSRPLLAEIRRTLAAVHNQLGSERVEAIYLFGTDEPHVQLARQLQENLQMPAETLHPLAELNVASHLRQRPPAGVGRFAPLLGMLLDAAEEGSQTIDFLHPRRRPEPPSRRRKVSFYATAAAVLLLAIVGTYWLRLRALDTEADRLSQQVQQVDAFLKQVEPTVKASAEVERWVGARVNWLDELQELNKELPPARDVMLTKLRFGPRVGGGVIELEGVVREATVVDELEAALRSEHHTVESEGRRQDNERSAYPWQFKSRVIVAPRPPQQYTLSAVPSTSSTQPTPTGSAQVAPAGSTQVAPAGRTPPQATPPRGGE